MEPPLSGYAAAVLEDAADAGDLATVAADLAAVDDLFGRSPVLRAALTDTAVAPRARRAVILDLLSDKVSEPAARAVGYAAYAVAAPEVPVAVTWLRHRAQQAAEGEVIVEPSLGHLASRERIGGYAAAVFETLPTGDLEEVEDELFRFARTVESTPALRRALVDSGLPADVRGAVVTDLLKDRGHPTTLRLVHYAITGGRARDLVGTLNWLVERTAEARGWRVARVSAAAEVSDADRGRLVESLSNLSGQPVDLQVTIDPSLLAGVVVNIGDLRVDATARGRLNELREHVGSGTWWNPSALGSRPRTQTDSGTESEGAQ